MTAAAASTWFAANQATAGLIKKKHLVTSTSDVAITSVAFPAGRAVGIADRTANQPSQGSMSPTQDSWMSQYYSIYGVISKD